MKKLIFLAAILSLSTSAFALEDRIMTLAAEQARGTKFMITEEHEVIAVVPVSEGVDKKIEKVFSNGNKFLYECRVKYQELDTNERSAFVYSVNNCKIIK